MIDQRRVKSLLHKLSLIAEEHSLQDDEIRNGVFLSRLGELLGELGVVQLDGLVPGPLDFVAKMLYAYDHPAAGFFQWKSLDEDVRKTYRQKAADVVHEWREREA